MNYPSYTGFQKLEDSITVQDTTITEDRSATSTPLLDRNVVAEGMR